MHHKRFLLALLITFICTAGLVGAINYLVDPYGLFSNPRVDGFNRLKPKAGLRTRVVKPYQVLRVKPRTLIVGNSRPEMGIDPRSDCLGQEYHPVYNLGMPGADMYMQTRVVQHALSTGGVRTILMSIDFIDFLTDKEGPEDVFAWPERARRFESRLRVDRFGESNHVYTVHRVGDYLMGLFSLTGFADSIATLAVQGNSNASTRRPDGFNPARDYLDIIETEGQAALFQQKNPEIVTSMSRSRLGIFQGGTRWSTSFESLRRLLRSARLADAHVTLFINPYHADYLTAIDLSGRWGEFEQWKRMLVELVDQEGGVPLWDFSLVNKITTEVPPSAGETRSSLQWFWEPAHYRSEVGELLLARMFDKKCNDNELYSDIGVKITKEYIQVHLEKARRVFYRFKANHKSEVARLEKKAR